MKARKTSNVCVRITYKFGRHAAVNDGVQEVISCSVEQAVHDFSVRFYHNNPGRRLEITKAEAL